MKKSIFLVLICFFNCSYQNLFANYLLEYFYEDQIGIKWPTVGFVTASFGVLAVGGFASYKAGKYYLNSAFDDIYTNPEKACLKVAAFCLAPYFLSRLMKYRAYSTYLVKDTKIEGRANKIRDRYEIISLFTDVGFSGQGEANNPEQEIDNTTKYQESLFNEIVITSGATLIGGSALLYRMFNKK